MILKITKLIAISCLTIFSVATSFAQIIGEDDILRDITPVIDIIAIKNIQLQATNDLNDLVDDEVNEIHQMWQQSLDGKILRDDTELDSTPTDIDLEEANIESVNTDTDDTEKFGNSEYASDDLIVEYIENEIEFLAYPNPAKDLLNIKFEDDGYFEISLFNVVGKLEIYYQSFEQNSHILDVSNLSVGMYLLQIFDGTNVKTKRINVVR